MSHEWSMAGSARGAAVAVVLAVGAFASIATTAPLEECPEPDVTVSPFYGSQDYDTGSARQTAPPSFITDGITVHRAWVLPPGCAGSGGDPAEVYVSLTFEHDGTGPNPEDAFAGLVVRAGDGSTFPVDHVDFYQPPPSDDHPTPAPSSANIAFRLPLDLPAPVDLMLGDLTTAGGLDRLSLDPREGE